MTILQRFKANACNNKSERPWSFATGLVAVIGGTLGIVVYVVCWLTAALGR